MFFFINFQVPISSSSTNKQRLSTTTATTTNNTDNNTNEIIKRRSESLPPPLARPIQPDLSLLATQTPEPSRTYSPELSVLKNDKSTNFFDFNPQALAAASWESLLDANKPPEKPQSVMGHHPVHHPYSTSLDNLDPKEFLVDAGIVLDQNTHQNTLVTASSMPNLAIGKYSRYCFDAKIS